ncbi:MAG: AmmeMemoRadiSam system protein A [Spirochaetia bacterium]|jgi:AmmeMemoRadiSam system protein A|nr:AmmeMemoRadiSam system protein A [Spirochaetia bacterium]
MNLTLSQSDRVALLATAREAIAARLEDRKPAWPDIGEAARETHGAFVTLHKSTESGQRLLRGCIGRLRSDERLDVTIKAMALSAAFDDPRFPPVIHEELDSIDVEISVLSPFEPCVAEDVEPGLHGVYLTRAYRSGVFLPQVATEQGWDRDELLDQLCAKAGLPPGSHKAPDAKLYLFSAIIFGEKRY